MKKFCGADRIRTYSANGICFTDKPNSPTLAQPQIVEVLGFEPINRSCDTRFFTPADFTKQS